MPVPDSARELIERFALHGEEYRTGRFNETQLRRDFLDPFFEALGWDVSNTAGYAEAYRDVIHEDAIKVGGATKAPDYCFRIGGTRKFFVEAKKPGVNLKTDASPAYQLRRYGWSAKLPLCILTDFEEFAVYDCRKRPELSDKASTARTMYLKCTDFVEQWEKIAGVFSREAVLKGSFDKYADSTKKKRGTAEVDDAFLAEIEAWREMLARNIALRNDLGVRELNHAVQKTIDRLVFLRICEDRGTETYGRLQALQNGPKVYERLTQLFEAADDRYNSGLFHFHHEKNRAESPDEWTLSLTIDDKPLKQIVKHLYYPDSPYEFSVLPADILGQVYERFLGSVIRLTPGGSAKVEEKPEVRKAGGVYYTPTYIVDYIVENTVGKLLEGAEVKQVERRDRRLDRTLRVLDPACGSGSFLLGAYQYLLDWHLQWYCDHDPETLAATRNPPIYRGPQSAWRLTSAERKRILLDHVFGVDIDPQAVEVTKLSLLLKVLEGETRETIDRELFAKERALPDLAENIKCGNSLIGSDFYRDKQLALFDEEEQLRINAFDWELEFGEIMKGGGFDAVIGNPPYVRIQNLDEFDASHYVENYITATGKFDIYLLFVERSLDITHSKSKVGFILPNKFLSADYGTGLRTLISRSRTLSAIIDFNDCQIFDAATTYTCLLFLGETSQHFQWTRVGTLAELETPESWLADTRSNLVTADLSSLGSEPWILADETILNLTNKLLESYPTLANVASRIFQGLISGGDRLLYLDADAVRDWRIEDEIIHPILKGKEVRRYFIEQPNFYAIYPYESSDGETSLIDEARLASKFPRAFSYLESVKATLESRGSASMTYPSWYSYWCERKKDLLESPKLVTQVLAKGNKFAYDENGKFFFVGGGNAGVYGIILEPQLQSSGLDYNFLSGLLNSRVSEFLIKQISSRFRGGYYSYAKRFIEQLPIRPIDFNNSSDRASHDQMVSLVQQMRTLNERRVEAKTAHQKTHLQRQIEATDREIDRLVYELYGLTDEEIRIVEEATNT